MANTEASIIATIRQLETKLARQLAAVDATRYQLKIFEDLKQKPTK